MKTQISRGVTLAAVSIALWFCAGCDEQNVVADEATAAGAASPAVDVAQGNGASPTINADADGDLNEISTNAPEAKLVKPAEVPDNLKISPALTEVVKLVQAGVSEDVILAYVTKADQPFGVGSDEIVYLNDLGVSTELLTSLLQHDSDRRGTTQPLPSNLALTSPATNIYPPTIATPPLTPPADQAYAPAPAEVATTAGFYNSLSPYGNWVEVDGYGLCWQPTVAVVDTSWRPYSDRGRWLWSDSGWYWYSDYSWGWAPFHYGRWASYPRLGWIWVPGNVWGPSWVTWRYTDDYCGWAPLPPFCNVVSGRGLWYRGSAVSVSFGFGLGADFFPWVPIRHLGDPLWRHHLVPRNEGRALYSRSTVINNYVVRGNTVINQGMPHDRVTRMGATVPHATLVDTRAPGRSTMRAEQISHSGSSLVVRRPRLASETPVPSTPPRDEPTRSRFVSAPNSAPTGGGMRIGNTPSRGATETVHSRLSPVLPARPQVTVDAKQNATTTARTEQPTSTHPNYGTQPYVSRPRSFSEARNSETPAPALPNQHSAPTFSSGKVTPLPPPVNSSGSSVSRNIVTPPAVPSTARPSNPQGAMIINRGNAGTTPLNRPVGAPFVRESGSSGFAANETQNNVGRSVVGSPPPITSTPGAVHSDPSRAVGQPAPRYSPAPSMSIGPSVRAPAALPPAIRSEVGRSYSPPSAVAAPPARSYSPPPAAAAPPAARSYSTAPARSESGGGGSRGRGRD